MSIVRIIVPTEYYGYNVYKICEVYKSDEILDSFKYIELNEYNTKQILRPLWFEVRDVETNKRLGKKKRTLDACYQHLNLLANGIDTERKRSFTLDEG